MKEVLTAVIYWVSVVFQVWYNCYINLISEFATIYLNFKDLNKKEQV